MNISIRRLYLYIASLIGLVILIIASVNLVSLGLKTWVLTKADDAYTYDICRRPVALEGEEKIEFDEEECKQRQVEEKTARRQREAASAIAMIVVGLPVWYYHWNKVKDEGSRDE